MVSVDQMESLTQSKEMLHLLFSNKYLPRKLSLYVLYNRSSENKERYEWMTTKLFNEQLGLDKVKEKFNLQFVESGFHDCNYIESSLSTQEQLSFKMQDFARSVQENSV